MESFDTLYKISDVAIFNALLKVFIPSLTNSMILHMATMGGGIHAITFLTDLPNIKKLIHKKLTL